MNLNRLLRSVSVLAAVAVPCVDHAQAPVRATPRDTTTSVTAGRKADSVPPGPHSVQICIDCGGWGHTGPAPMIIFKDSEYRVVMISGPGDTAAVHDTAGGVQPAWIDRIDVIKPAAAVAALGRGFEQGIITIVLTPAGSEAWRREHARRASAAVAH